MSHPKISTVSLSFNSNTQQENNSYLRPPSGNRFRTRLNKSIGIGTTDDDKKSVISKRALITSLNFSSYLPTTEYENINDEITTSKFKSSRNSRKKLELNQKKFFVNNSQLKNYKYLGKYKIPRIKTTKGNILKNQILKNTVTYTPKPPIKYSYMHFQKRSKAINDNIVSDGISLIDTLINQTTSNFNNKYQVQYWTNNKKKREEIKYCFNLIKKGTKLIDIDNILNGPKEVITYRIQTDPNLDFPNLNEKYYTMKSIKDRKNKYNMTINTLEHLRPLTSKN